jgi:hypothetical protein
MLTRYDFYLLSLSFFRENTSGNFQRLFHGKWMTSPFC